MRMTQAAGLRQQQRLQPVLPAVDVPSVVRGRSLHRVHAIMSLCDS